METAIVLDFPSAEDQQVIRDAVQTFLLTQTGRTRELMLKTIRAVLDRYRITKFGFADYYVYATSEPKWSMIRAKKAIETQACPGCGSNIYHFKSTVRILGIEEFPSKHFVTYGCKCGTVFGKWELFLN